MITQGPLDNPKSSGSPPHLKIPHFITPAKSLLTCKVTKSQVPGTICTQILDSGSASWESDVRNEVQGPLFGGAIFCPPQGGVSSMYVTDGETEAWPSEWLDFSGR